MNKIMRHCESYIPKQRLPCRSAQLDNSNQDSMGRCDLSLLQDSSPLVEKRKIQLRIHLCELEIGKKPIMWSTGTHTSTSRMIIVRSAMKGVITIDEHCWQTLWQESVCQQWAGKSDNSKRKLTKCWVVQFESEQFFGGWVLTKYVGPTYLTASNNQQIRKIRKQN